MNIYSPHALNGNVTGIPCHGFSKARVVIVGDLMLDRYVLGSVTRISPEAPAPVLAVREERTVAGGAANVALNAAGLRAKVVVVGVVGQDAAGKRLLEIFSQHGIGQDGVIEDLTRPTTCKTRLMCNSHQIVRIDSELCDDLAPELCSQLSARVDAILGRGVDAVILSDYAKGVLTPGIIRHVIATCAANEIPVLVDPKRSDYTPYSGATCITPNEKELGMALAAISIPSGDVGACGALLRDRLGCDTLLVTQGANGMTAITGEHAHHSPALTEEVFDVSGAGDTVIATVATCLAGRLDMISAVRIANVAASLVVRRAGTVPVEWEELYPTLTRHSGHMSHELPPSKVRLAG